MNCATAALALLLPLLAAGDAVAEDAPPAETIAWAKDLSAALESAKTSKKPVMVCINAKSVDGRTDEEPAAKGLREVVYRDPRIVKRSKDFECVFLTPQGTATEYSQLRTLGIAGAITSPQHIFIAAAGDRILLRREYWSHGKGEPAVKALLDMMAEAEAAATGKAPPKPTDGPAAPEGGEERARWIAERIDEARQGGDRRDGSLWALAAADRAGDCTGPMLALLEEGKKDTALVVAIVRALGRDGLEAAALPVSELLNHREAPVRGNAAVTLEYIGSHDEKVVVALSKYVGKEKDEALANHGWRALGRCGSKNPKVGGILVAGATSAKSDYASYGPIVGLSYFKGDAKTVRAVEKMLKQLGMPGGRRGGGGDGVQRGLVSWTLANIGDYDSATFVKEELLESLKNNKAFWVAPLRTYWENVALACQGTPGALEEVDNGMKGIVAFTRNGFGGRPGTEIRNLADDCRKGREAAGFKPRGEGLIDQP